MGKTPDFERARDYAVTRLENELSPNLTYHCLKHTLEEVVPAADRLAFMENIGDDDRLLLLTGAYYHDIGFICQRQGHEAISLQLAEQALPGFGYSKTQIVVIQGVIQATCIPQSPKNSLEMIMADADLDYLGGEYFWERSIDLRLEFDHYGTKFTDEDWYKYQLLFIQAHRYFTVSARSLREASKQQHLREIKQRLELVNQLKKAIE
jgi:uncharacterized protein